MARLYTTDLYQEFREMVSEYRSKTVFIPGFETNE